MFDSIKLGKLCKTHISPSVQAVPHPVCMMKFASHRRCYMWKSEAAPLPLPGLPNSSVSGHEGDNVSVQCFYTSGYQNKPKQWCRYKDKGCYTEKRTDTSQNPSVQISDDGRRSFTVLMTGLRLSDSGWYLCSVGDMQAPVQLTVNEPKPVTHIPTTTPSDPETDK
ncbi:unnamed protein product [Leuciscus chuanchicus]